MESATSTGGPAHPTTNGTGIAVENPRPGRRSPTFPTSAPTRSTRMVAAARAAQPDWAAVGFEGRAEVLLAAPRLDGRATASGSSTTIVRRDRQPGRRDAVRRARLRALGARVLGEDARRLPGGRGDRVRVAVRLRRPPAGGPLRAARRRRRDRALELPAEQLVRRLHPGACRRQRRRPEALRGHPADLAADGRDAGRVRPARGRLPGRDGRAARPARRWSTRSTWSCSPARSRPARR